ARNHALLATKLSELGHPNAQIKFIKAEAPPRPSAPGPASSDSPALPTAPAPAPAAPAAAAPAPKPPVAVATAKAAPSAAQKEKSASIPFNKDDFKDDPLIQKALEVFKGQIVEVRA